MRINERLRRTKVERATVLLTSTGAAILLLSTGLHRSGFISSETSNYMMLASKVLLYSALIPLHVRWKQTKAQEKLRLQKETDDAARAETYLNTQMTNWK